MENTETPTGVLAAQPETQSSIVHKVHHGRVHCEIERRDGKAGVFYSTRLFRWYKESQGDDGEPKFQRAYTYATSGRGDDLGDAMTATAEARNWILAQPDYEAPADTKAA